MTYSIEITEEAYEDLKNIKNSHKSKDLSKKIKKTIAFLQENPEHNSLNSHEYEA